MSHFAFILPDLNGGGAQKMMINIANEFSASGDKIDLILFRRSGVYADLLHQNIRVIELNKNKSIYALIPLVNYFIKSSPQAVFTALNYVNLIVLSAKILTFKKDIKIIVSERNNLSNFLQYQFSPVSFFYRLLVRFLYPKSNYIIGISNGVCDDLKNYISKKHHHKIKTIYNPVVVNSFETLVDMDTPSYFSSTCPLKLVTSGRLEKQKDYPTMFHALAIYKRAYGNFELVIMGEGSLKRELTKLARQLDIENNISFIGFVSNPLAVIKQADIFVISSAWEGFCNVIIEALYCSKPVVATNCSFGPAEILNSSNFGQLVPVGDSEKFCEAINFVRNFQFDSKVLKDRALEFSATSKSLEFRKLIKKNA